MFMSISTKTLPIVVLLLSAPAAAFPTNSDEATSSDEEIPQQTETTAQQERIDALEQQIADLERWRRRREEAEFGTLSSSGFEGTERPLRVYGFFDMTLTRNFVHEDSYIDGMVVDKLSFSITNLNVYFASDISETLRALVELRFSFLPAGKESFLPYERTTTKVTDPFTTASFDLGGVTIERVHLTWQPHDYFGVTAGRFLTPFGIWNIDHGTPVLIPAVPPYLMIREFVPLAQTGLMLHGRVYPHGRLYLNYALTLSNGRGPTEQVYDLEDDKAIGLRLRLEYEGNRFYFAVGGYGYFGHTTDITKTVAIVEEGIDITTEETESYREYTGAADLLIRFFGVRIQAEYVRGYTTYDTRPLRYYEAIDLTLGPEHQPDFIKQVVYGLLAWDLPLDQWLDEMTLTPFGMIEYSIEDDTDPQFTTLLVRGGLNFRPTPAVVLKAGFRWATSPESGPLDPPFWSVVGQLAVAF